MGNTKTLGSNTLDINSIKNLSLEEKKLLLSKLLKEKGQKDKYPLSYGQEGLWFEYKLLPESSAYNVCYTAKIMGYVDVQALKAAFSELIKRHKTLSTVFKDSKEKNMQAVQYVKNDTTVCFEEKSIENMNASEIALLLTKDSNRSFNLETGPLIRVGLYRLSDEESIILFVIHHIVADFWSLGVILKELSFFYDSIKDGRKALLHEQTNQYTDFVKWQREMIKGETGEKHWKYWEENLSGELPVLNLPVSKTRPNTVCTEGAVYNYMIDRDAFKKVKDFAASRNTTLFTLLLSVYYVLLYRYTGQEDIIVGSPVAGRNNASFFATVGYFVNMLPLRSGINGSQSFDDFLKQVRETVFGALEHQDYPFSLMVEKLQPVRDIKRTPIFQVSFTLEKATSEMQEGAALFVMGHEKGQMNMGSLKMESFELEKKAAPFELSLLTEEIDGQLFTSFQYQTALFDEESIKRMAIHFKNLLESLVAFPSKGLGEHDFLSGEEKNQIINVFNKRDGVYQKGQCIHGLIASHGETAPGSTALVFEEKILTYRELNEKANKLANYLKKAGIKEGENVPICLEPSLEMVIGILGILKAGCAYVPINHIYPDDRIDMILEDIKPKLLITQDLMADRMKKRHHDILSLDGDWNKIEGESPENPVSSPAPDSPAYIIYTSGSTGRPKGVIISHYNVVRLFKATKHWYNFGSSDIWTLFHSFAFDFSVWEIFGALIYGGKLVIVPYYVSRSPEDFYKLLSREKVTVLNQTPSAFRQLIQADERLWEKNPLSLRWVVFGGEALEFKILEPWFNRYGDTSPRLVNMYGITETTVHVTFKQITTDDLKKYNSSNIGVPIPDLQVYLMDSSMKLVPIGVCGEIYVGGSGVAKGYLNRAELSKERFIDDFLSGQEGAKLYKSGDLARFLPNGEMEYLGRIDHQIKIRGFRVELGEIEARMLEHPSVRETTVLTGNSNNKDVTIIAYIVLKEGHIFNLAELKSYLKKKVPDYMVPAFIMPVSEFPLTANGKIDRKKLPNPTDMGLRADNEFIMPRNEIEVKITSILKELLGVERVSIDDNFFDLGGNSLLIVQAQSRINECLGTNITVMDMFQNPSVKAISEFLSSNKEEEAEEITNRADIRRSMRGRRRN